MSPPSYLTPEQILINTPFQLLNPLMSLATLRTHVWKGGNDIVLHYKANGRKEIKPFIVPEPAAPAEPERVDAPTGGEPNNTLPATATTPAS
jgi:WD repeat-containing protein 48